MDWLLPLSCLTWKHSIVKNGMKHSIVKNGMSFHFYGCYNAKVAGQLTLGIHLYFQLFQGLIGRYDKCFLPS